MAKKRSTKAKAKETPARAAAGEPDGVGVSPERVAARAYEIYLARGGEPGREIEDWLRAEAEVGGATRES